MSNGSFPEIFKQEVKEFSALRQASRLDDTPERHGISDSGPNSQRGALNSPDHNTYIGKTFKIPDSEDKIDMELENQQQTFNAGPRTDEN